MRGKKRINLVYVGIIAVLGLLFFHAALVLTLMLWDPPDLENWFRPKTRQKFSKELWADTSYGDKRRYKMANDLVVSELLIGKSENEIRTLLGDPTRFYEPGNEVSLEYELVHQRDFPAKCPMLPSFLFINMDTWLLEIQCERGRVKSVRIRYT